MLAGLRRRIGNIPSDLMQRAVALPRVKRWRDSRSAARTTLYRANVTPGATARRIAAELEASGIVQLPLGSPDLPDFTPLLSVAQQMVADHAATLAATAERQDFVLLPPAEMTRHSEIFRYGLDPALLEIVETYLGQPVAYDGVVIQYTPPDGRVAATRMWHRDREDRRMLKLAFYLNDVDENGGPFELLPLAHIDRGPHGDRADPFILDDLDQDVLAASGLFNMAVSCTGPAGTAILADTARFFHRGRPATGRARGAIFYSYFAARPEHPFFCDRSGLTRSQVRSLVREMDGRQRAAALWHDRLPLGWRLVPSAAL